MTGKIYIHMGSSNKTVPLPANPPPLCKDVVDTLGGGILLEGDDLLLHSRTLEAGKHYTFIKEITAGDRSLAEYAQRSQCLCCQRLWAGCH